MIENNYLEQSIPLRVARIRNRDVLLDRAVAEAFGVETRIINQAVARNPQKFGDEHVFQLTSEEVERLTSQGVISKPGRGGSRSLPWVFSIKGVTRLATVVNSPRALQATDLILDVFIEVWKQVAKGASEVLVSNPSRLLPAIVSPELVRLRKKLVHAMDELLDFVVNPKTKATVRDEIEETAAAAFEYFKERLKTRGLENDRLTAETAHILEQVRDLRDRREADLKHKQAVTEGILLDNLTKKLDVVDRIQKMVERLEPNALVSLYSELERPALPAPSQQPNEEQQTS